MNRLEQLRLKQTTEWDVIVIEASGLGTALDAASRGIKQFY
jgi:glycerol-3-phosphate dehydrogenase